MFSVVEAQTTATALWRRSRQRELSVKNGLWRVPAILERQMSCAEGQVVHDLSRSAAVAEVTGSSEPPREQAIRFIVRQYELKRDRYIMRYMDVDSAERVAEVAAVILTGLKHHRSAPHTLKMSR